MDNFLELADSFLADADKSRRKGALERDPRRKNVTNDQIWPDRGGREGEEERGRVGGRWRRGRRGRGEGGRGRESINQSSNQSINQ